MSTDDKKAIQVGVVSEDPQRKEGEKKGKDGEPQLSEEDARIKEQVSLLVTRAADSNPGIAKIAVEQLADLLRTSSSGSVASVPKPLKYVRALYPELEQALKTAQDPDLQRRLHDVLSFVAMTLEFDDGRRVSLEHKLKGTQDDLSQWGHEYLRFLAGGLGEEWKERAAKNESTAYLNGFVDQVVQYMITHQDEPSAIDLLMEVDDVSRIIPLIDETNYKRIANYVSAMSRYLTRPADVEVLGAVYEIYAKMSDYPNAVITALQLGDTEKITALFAQCKSPATRLQMALTCARFKVFLDLDDEEEVLQDANGNMRLSQLYRHSAKELDSLAPKKPEEVFKTGESSTGSPKDHRFNLACAFVSGLANCGFGKDEYLTRTNEVVYVQHEDHLISTTAAMGLLHLWDHTEGLHEIDKFFYADNPQVKAGACLAAGLTMCGVKNPFDPAQGLLAEHISSTQKDIAIGAILGLGYAYAGTRKEDVKDSLVPFLADHEQALEVQCMAAYALAMVYVGTADEDISETMINCLMEIPEEHLTETCVRYLILALGCMFLGCQEAADTLIDATQALSPLIQQYTEIVVRSCAFAATGNVVIIQKFFHIIADNEEAEEEEEEHDEANPPAEEEKEKPKPLNYKAAAVLGIGVVAVGEELGMEMAKRAIIHVLLADTVMKGENGMSGRHAVPLVYALLSASNPNMAVVETLNRLAHDSNAATATNSILAMGLVAAGSNNARVAQKLRNLALYYQKDKFAPLLFVVRLAQGLCAMGKGHLTLSPLQNNRISVCPTALMGLLGILHSALELNKTILDKYHYMFYAITPSISPRFVMAVDENMEPVDNVQVRVGLPVDTVAVPGKPKSITGFQTHTTPVLLSSTDKVELADQVYRPIPSVIEGPFVVEPKPAVE